VGCATTQAATQNRENMLVASGFNVITPKTAAQQQKLQNLPPGKVTMIQKAGRLITSSRTRRITRPMSEDPSSTGIIMSCARQISSPRRTWKPPRCTRTRRWNGVYGAAGAQVWESGDPWEGRDRGFNLVIRYPLATIPWPPKPLDSP